MDTCSQGSPHCDDSWRAAGQWDGLEGAQLGVKVEHSAISGPQLTEYSSGA